MMATIDPNMMKQQMDDMSKALEEHKDMFARLNTETGQAKRAQREAEIDHEELLALIALKMGHESVTHQVAVEFLRGEIDAGSKHPEAEDVEIIQRVWDGPLKPLTIIQDPENPICERCGNRPCDC